MGGWTSRATTLLGDRRASTLKISNEFSGLYANGGGRQWYPRYRGVLLYAWRGGGWSRQRGRRLLFVRLTCLSWGGGVPVVQTTLLDNYPAERPSDVDFENFKPVF